ncbi:voltage-gated chloride channel family protein [Halorussus amylolyticus]|uniref:hypothetical protein n=1 Tax=Halorussus amylolyticus TaxID=1126242 RepID=UPI001EE490D5|nr:hypothetical protein [Halorussus amylolyticus]
MRRSAAFVVLVAVVVSGVGGPMIALAQDDAESAAARNLGLEELTPGGTKPTNAPASVRQNGQYGEFAVKTLPTGLMVDESETSPSWRYLRPGETVKRNYVQLHSKRAYGEEAEDYVVEVAHYRVGQERYETNNGETSTQKAAVNVTTYERTVSLAGGYDYAEIDLRDHYDQKVRTVMCVREPDGESCLENPGDTRWTFYHQSSKATLPIETNSAGARLAWGILSLLLPFFGSTVVTLYGGRKAVEKAKAGPQISALWWILVAIGGIMFVVMAWDWLSATLIRAPYLVSAAGGVLLGVIAVEWFGRRTYGAGFLQFHLDDGFDPTDPEAVEDAVANAETDAAADTDPDEPTDAPGVLKASFTVTKFARGDTGERSAIRKGIRKFWARARDATADLEVNGNMQTKIEVDGPIEELYLLDPEDDDPLEYTPEHHVLEFPDLVTYDDEGNRQIHPVPYVAGFSALGMSWMAGQLAAGSGLLGVFLGGLGIFAVKVAKPRDGRLYANLAPIHYHHAVGSMLTHARGLADAKSWDDWFRNYAESEAETHADRKELMDDRSESQLDQLYKRYVAKDGAEDGPVRDNSQEASADD